MNKEKRNFTDDQMLRRNAEELLKKKQVKMDKLAVETDAIKLLHELQVHQIELEMQNEELIQANETAETALRKYTMLYDFAPMGYFTLESDGIINELNFTGAEMLGDKRFSLVNSKEACEVKLGYNGNTACTVYMEGIVTGEDKNCLLSVVDISGFRK